MYSKNLPIQGVIIQQSKNEPLEFIMEVRGTELI
jgi:hypothetical protein